MIALILCWHIIHLAVINFQLLILALWFDIWKRLSVVHAVFERFFNHISAIHVSLVLDLISPLNWFDLTHLKFQHGGYLFLDEMIKDFGKNEEAYRKNVHQRHQERAISYDSNCKINKGDYTCISYSWFLDVLIKRLFHFFREIGSPLRSPYLKNWPTSVKSPYFKHWPT